MSDSPLPGMGALPRDGGVVFRVWAPHAKAASVIGSFNDFQPTAHPMAHEGEGCWYADVPAAKVGQEYRFWLDTESGPVTRIDPYAREVTNSIGNGVIVDPRFDWGDERFEIPNWNELVIYELHVGTFNDVEPDDGGPAKFENVVHRFDHLKTLGVNCIQIMPVAEFSGDRSWGYNPAHIFAVESAYGGPRGFKELVKQAHRHGIAVILDVVYNHFGPSDLDLWRFDGWSENDGGGIYFYNDWRRTTPWGDTRPDYGRPQVREFIRDNALMWLEEFRVDGLRMDMTLYIRAVDAAASQVLPDGWSLMRWVNTEIRSRFPRAITIAEDLQNNPAITDSAENGGAAFGTQWDAQFVHPIREAVIAGADEQRSMEAVKNAILSRYNGDPIRRVVYSESHDEVANGRARVPQEIDPDGASNWFAQKRSTLAAALVLTSPGIPMLFQGQEFVEGEWFRDTVPLHWDQTETFRGIVRMYRDLIHLRLNKKGTSKGLTGPHVAVTHVNDEFNLIAFRRWENAGPNDEVVVVANFHREARGAYNLGFSQPGTWKLVFNSDWSGYSEQFRGHPSADAFAVAGEYDGLPNRAEVSIGAYSVLIFAHHEPDA